MLHKETVEAGTLDLIKTLMKDKELNAFNLVGGTALALLHGHRKSEDIDLFTQNTFDSAHLAAHLSKNYPVQQIHVIKNGVFCFISDIKVDLLAHQYPLIKPISEIEGIRMLSLDDIAAMKLNAIVQNGTRLKDYVDIYTLLEALPLQTMTNGYEMKYPDVNAALAKAALIYHDDVNRSFKVNFTQKEISWMEISKRLHEAVIHSEKVFQKAEIKREVKEKQKIIVERHPKKGRRLR